MTEKTKDLYLSPREAFILFGRYRGHDGSSTDLAGNIHRLSAKERASLLAVSECLRTLEIIGEKECITALNEVYFSLWKRDIKKAPVTAAVRRFAYEAFMDERTVYRRLARASKIYNAITETETTSHFCKAA